MIDRHSIASVSFTILGTIFHWKVICQPSVALHSTDAEICGFCVGAKTIQHFCPLMEALGVPVHLTTPTDAAPGHEDNQPTIDIIKAGKVTTRVKHIAMPVAHLNEHCFCNMVAPIHMDTKIQPADMGTKPLTGPLLHDHFCNARGVQHCPPENSEHCKLLELHLCNPKDLCLHAS